MQTPESMATAADRAKDGKDQLTLPRGEGHCREKMGLYRSEEGILQADHGELVKDREEAQRSQRWTSPGHEHLSVQ